MALIRRALRCSVLLCSAAALPPALQVQKRHDKMVAALLHRALRVPPWARQSGLWAFGCVPRRQRASLTGRDLDRGIREASSLEQKTRQST